MESLRPAAKYDQLKNNLTLLWKLNESDVSAADVVDTLIGPSTTSRNTEAVLRRLEQVGVLSPNNVSLLKRISEICCCQQGQTLVEEYENILGLKRPCWIGHTDSYQTTSKIINTEENSSPNVDKITNDSSRYSRSCTNNLSTVRKSPVNCLSSTRTDGCMNITPGARQQPMTAWNIPPTGSDASSYRLASGRAATGGGCRITAYGIDTWSSASSRTRLQQPTSSVDDVITMAHQQRHSVPV